MAAASADARRQKAHKDMMAAQKKARKEKRERIQVLLKKHREINPERDPSHLIGHETGK